MANGDTAPGQRPQERGFVQAAGDVICIIGDGVVGGALRQWFLSQGADVRAYDPPKGMYDPDALDAASVIFICVPTPYAPVRGFDDRYLIDAVEAVPGARTIVVKSTVRPGTTDALQQAYPQHRFLFNPEFLREASAVRDMLRPDRQIVGVTDMSASEAERVLAMLPAAPYRAIVPAREAEMAKYVANAFLAMKVSFANEVYDTCAAAGIDYDGVRAIVAADPRIGGSHMDVLHGGFRGYAGKCLPKDSKALIDLGASLGLPMRVLRAADAVNAMLIAPVKGAPAVTAPASDETAQPGGVAPSSDMAA